MGLRWRLPPALLKELAVFLNNDDEDEIEPKAPRHPSSSSHEGVDTWDDWDFKGSREKTPGDGVEEAEVETDGWWLAESLICGTAGGETLVLSVGQRLVVVEGSEGSARIVGRAELPEVISAVACVGMAASRRSETRGWDWVAVVAGLEDGSLVFLSESGQSLFTQRFSRAPVLSVGLGRSEWGAEELSVLHQDVLVTVDGLSLYAELRASTRRTDRHQDANDKRSRNLHWRKWSLEERGDASAHVTVGAVKSGGLEQMETASAVGGAWTSLSSSVPNRKAVWLVGQSPYLAFYPVDESGSGAGIGEAVRSLADAVKTSVSASASSLLSGLWGGGSSAQLKAEEEGPPPEDVRASRVQPRNLFFDSPRQGNRLSAAPFGSLLALTDHQARVLLVCTRRREILRVWKGYRDAEVAWLSLREEGKSGRRALFLAILAPKRGLLEIWSCENGPRVGAWSVDRRARLLTAVSWLGSLGEGEKGSEGRAEGARDVLPSSVLLLLPSGELSAFHVPFHAALQDESSAHLHDAALGKELSEALGRKSASDASEVLARLRTLSALRSAAAHIIAEADSALSVSAAVGLLEEIQKSPLIKESPEAMIFRSHLAAQLEMIHRFAELRALNEAQRRPAKGAVDVAAVLRCDSAELERLSDLLAQASELAPPPALDLPSLSTFLDAFHHAHSEETSEGWSLTLSPSVVEQSAEGKALRRSLGRLLFRPVLSEATDLDHFLSHIIQPLRLEEWRDALFPLLLDYWLGQRKDFPTYPPILLHLLRAFSGEGRAAKLETLIRRGDQLPETLILALVTRALLQTAEEAEARDADDEGERLELAEEKWDLFVLHLELLLKLQLLGSRLGVEREEREGQLSLEALLNGGRSFYREEVGRLVARSGKGPEEVESVLGGLAELPLSLDAELVRADAAWEAAVLWHKGKERVELLTLSCAHLAALRSARLRHGMALSVWDTFLKKPFRALHLLLEKVGKFPKERLCRKELGIGEDGVLAFVAVLRSLLLSLAEGCAKWESDADEGERWEGPLEALFLLPDHSASSRHSLCAQAKAHKPCNYHLALHHLHLADTLFLLLRFRVKPARPSLYFDAKGLEAFFSPMHSHPLLGMAEVDLGTRGQRERLLQGCVEGEDEAAEELGPEEEDVLWELCDGWEVDGEVLRRAKVLRLYRAGREEEAEALLPSVSSRPVLGAQLLLFLGQRLAAFLEEAKSQPTNASAVSALPPRLIAWLQSLPPPDHSPAPPRPEDLPRLGQLLSHVSHLLTPQHAEAQHANDLALLIRTFQP